MKEVIRVEPEKRISKAGKEYTMYHVLLADGTEATSLTKFKVGDWVQPWYDHEWQTTKLKRIDKR